MTDHRASLEEAEIAAQRLARQIDAGTPAGWRFMLFLASEGYAGYSTYVSNVERESAIEMVREWLARMDAGRDFCDNETRDDCWCCGEIALVLFKFKGPVREVMLCSGCMETRSTG